MEGGLVDGAAELGSQIAGYRVKSVLGQGGMATVYLVERPQGGVCALKVLSRRLADDPSYAARFKREAEYAEALEHPHILELYDSGETPDGTLYLAMQYVPGVDLSTLLVRRGPLDLGSALDILGQIGEALDCAHSRGLIHRDVKPGNIIVAEYAGDALFAYLTDFGLSKNPDADSVALTKQGQFVGTTAYTAPEEILAQPRDHRVDIYSLGCVLYEALVGEPPFVRERELDVMYAHIGDPRPGPSARRPDLPAELDAIIAKAMAIAPAERYSTCGEFVAAATALVPTEAIASAAPVAPAPEPPAPVSAPPAPSAPSAAAPAPASSLRLRVVAGPAQGRELILSDDLALGRLETLDGALESDRQISRRHAQVRRLEQGGFVVEDQHSANGTFVNGTRIEGAHPLTDGDQLRLGLTVFAVEANESAAEPDEAAAEPDEAAPPAQRAAIRLEFDPEAGRLSVTVDHGPSPRVIRDGDGWRVEIP